MSIELKIIIGVCCTVVFGWAVGKVARILFEQEPVKAELAPALSDLIRRMAPMAPGARLEVTFDGIHVRRFELTDAGLWEERTRSTRFGDLYAPEALLDELDRWKVEMVEKDREEVLSHTTQIEVAEVKRRAEA